MSNEVWVAGIRGGLRKIELREEGSAILSSFSRNAPYIEVVTSLFRDTRGWIWIGSSRGLNVLTSSGWRHFDVNSGLISNHIIYGAINEDDDGSLWFGTDSGMSHLTAEHIFPALPELHTCITSAYINSVNLLGNPRIWSDGERNLSVNFVAPTFVGSNDLNYRYILENVDTAPHTENETFANYSNVQGQQISFDVQAIDFINARSANHAHLAAHMGSGLGRSSRFLIAFVSCGFLFFLISGGSYRRYVMVRQKNIDRAVRDRTRVMEEIQAQLRQQSRVDGLTGLLNRRTALDELSYLISSLAPGELIAVSLIDIDHFKLINDTFGHQAGDFVLEQYGLRLRQTSGPGVMAGRYGGEELIIIYPIVRKIQSVIEEANTLHRVLCMPIRVEESIVVATCSIGLAIISPGDTPESLIGRADRALYKGKRGGRNCLIIAD
nr:GGDEF domain-containing protein [Acetobacter fallax]